MGIIINENLYLTFDDVQLVPQYSEVISRATNNLSTRISKRYALKIPILATPMDTICESRMAIAMMQQGGAGVIHRFLSIKDQVTEIQKVYEFRKREYPSTKSCANPIIAAIGITNDYIERAVALAEAGVNILLLDVAHGYHILMKNAMEKLKNEIKSKFSRVDFIAGNVSTYGAAFMLCQWGADGIRVGVGGGSLCSTRKNTGHGIPMISSISECAQAVEGFRVPIIADGGIRNSGDISKAIAAGAESVMLGSMIASTEETPGAVFRGHNGKMYKTYRGSASIESKIDRGEKRNIEGVATIKPYKGSVEFVINEIKDNLKSALSYSGVTNIRDFITNSEFIKITNAGIIEASTHGTK